MAVVVAATIFGICGRAALLTDIEYGRADDVPLLLDVSVPDDGDGPFPVAILVHGGGWGSGDKRGAETPNSGADISPWFAPLTEARFTWFSINYRLAPAHRWPACLDDTRAAIRWAKAHAAEYKGDPSRIALVGHSAGGHLVCMAATEAGDDTRVQAVVGCAAATDFEQDLGIRGGVSLALRNLFDLPQEVTPEALAILRATSPIHRVRPGLPPFLLIHGDADRSVPIEQSRNFKARLDAAGVPCELVVLPGAPHRLTQWQGADPAWTRTMVDWMRATLGGPKAAPKQPAQADVTDAGGPADGRHFKIMNDQSTPMRADARSESSSPGPWVPDLENGTYKNPVMFADYSDPDAIRVGDDFWMTSSSFCHVPGLPILHSRDLVNWELVNHALPRLVPEQHYATARAGCGVWAPAIRHHAGRFWIFYPDPDFGIYVISTEDPRGAWSEPILMKAGKGLIDPCPLWDDDGSAWLVHGWAKSRSGINNLLTLHRMAEDGSRVLDDGVTIIDANKMEGWSTLEGPKLYKHDGWYWVFAPAGGVAQGYQAVFRSRDIRGPYEARVVLAQGSTPVNGPHQGAWVDTPSGEEWFLHFQEHQPYGRVVHLQPMRWRADGWPVMGSDPANTGTGEPVLVHAMPDVPRQAVAVPATSDDFSGNTLGLQWQWQANSRAGWASLSAAPGALRLVCVPLAEATSHWTAAHLLMQKFPAPSFSVTTSMRFSPAADGDTAGLMVFGYDYAWLGLRRVAAGVQLVLASCTRAQDGGRESVVAAIDVPVAGSPVLLRVDVAEGGVCQFSWSGDNGATFSPVGAPFQSTESRWVGAKVGVFASSAPGARAPGHADFSEFLLK